MSEVNKGAVQRAVQLAMSESVFKKTGKIFVPVAASNRHIHLSAEDVERLFGKGYTLQVQKPLSQPGQYACKEVVTLVGAKGKLEKVRVLGPVRSKTQIEISVTDSFKLGVKAPVRMSGDVDGTPGVQIVGPAGTVDAPQGVIVAARHLHLSQEQAELFGLQNGQEVSLHAEGGRGMLFEHVVVRCGKGHDMEVHLDTDEANAAAMQCGTMMEVIR
jgi:putative phosphotransacetylase